MLATLRTPRLIMRPYSTDDIDPLHALWTSPGVRRYLWDDRIIERETAEQVVMASLTDMSVHGFGQWTLRLAEDGNQVMGFCGFRSCDDAIEPELLYGIAEPQWGKGLAYEASRAALLYLVRTTRAVKVHAATDEPNVQSAKVLERLGMKLIGKRPGPAWPNFHYELVDFERLLPFDAYTIAD
ncbi:MAG TPA: GNAT family N-acetyltransferase [Candidatus Binatia bacterium]|nr:GNAT family N-acetyltransferase [Candidatus Binatia bacterium]